MASHRIAVMPGDGIGKDTVPAGMRVLETAARRFGIGLAFAMGGWTVLHNRPSNFGILPEPRANARMITTGPYAWVRHPMYLGLMVLALGLAVGWNTGMHWLSAAALVLILVVKARREERFMRARFPGYDAYASRTPRLVPGPRRSASG